MIYAGTGHRPDKLGGYSIEAYARLYTVARQFLLEQGCETIVISGMALGWDQALAHAAAVLGYHWIAAVPFAGQESAWPQESQLRYKQLINCCPEVVTVCPGGYSPSKMQLRNQWMVDNCDTVLAMWDGSAGGTGNCIKYAEKRKRPIVNLHSVWSK